MQEMGWRIVAVNPNSAEVLGQRTYPTLADAPLPIGLIDVFRPAAEAPGMAHQAVAVGATALWLQLGIVSPEARRIAEEAGLLYVEDCCMAIEQRRLGLRAPR
jgi:uncharacterized protein